MKVPFTIAMLAISVLLLIYFSASIFNEVDNTINVTGTGYEDQQQATHNVTRVSLVTMNYMSLLLFLLFILAIAGGFIGVMR